MARRIRRDWRAVLWTLVFMSGIAWGDPAVRNGTIDTAAARVPDATALLGLPFDFRIHAGGSVEVAYATGEEGGIVRLCEISDRGVGDLGRLTGIWGPKLVFNGHAGALLGLRLDADAQEGGERTRIVVATLGSDKTGVRSPGEGESVLDLGVGPIHVFSVDGDGIYIGQGASVAKLGVDYSEKARWQMKGPTDSRIFDPQIVTDPDTPVVVAVANSPKGARIVSGRLGETEIDREVSDQSVPRIFDLQAVSAGDKLYCFWSEQRGHERRLMMDVSMDHGQSWSTDRILVDAVRNVTFEARGEGGRILLAWRLGERFDQPSHQNLTVGEVNSKGLVSQKSILECNQECSISDFDLDVSDSGRQFLAVAVQQSGRATVQAYWSDGDVNDYQHVEVAGMSEPGTIDCVRVSSQEQRSVVIYRFARAVRSLLQPFILGQLFFGVVDFQE